MTLLPDKVFHASNGTQYKWVKGEVHESRGPGVRRVWLHGDPTGATWYRDEISTNQPGLAEALDYYWPEHRTKTKVFGGIEWAPAGKGCVRVVSKSVIFHRARRHADGLEWQKMDSKKWVLNPYLTSVPMWDGNARAALDHFWPLKEAPTKTVMDRNGEIWRREGDELRSSSRGHMWRNTNKEIRVTWTGCDIGVKPGPTWHIPVIEALAPEWLEFVADDVAAEVMDPTIAPAAVSRTVLEVDNAAPGTLDKAAWTFVAVPEKVDIARCLREAYEAGAREVTINNDGQIETYCWPDTYNHTILPWCVATKAPFPATNRHKRIGDWIHIEHPALARARAWEAEERTKAEKARRVRVTVVGTR